MTYEARERRAELEVHFRGLAESDLTALGEELGTSHAKYFRRRLPLQKAGKGTILVAFRATRPVGAVLVLWDHPPDERTLRLRLPGVPLLYHVHVKPVERCRGIGTQLLAAVHDELRDRGYGRVTLGIDRNNKDAWRLYERLGYEVWEDDTWGRGKSTYVAMVLDLHRDDRTEFLGSVTRSRRTVSPKLRKDLIYDVLGATSSTSPEINRPAASPIKAKVRIPRAEPACRPNPPAVPPRPVGRRAAALNLLVAVAQLFKLGRAGGHLRGRNLGHGETGAAGS